MSLLIYIQSCDQPSVKNQLTVDRATPVSPNVSTSTKNIKPAEHSFTPAAVEIATDSKPSNLALTLVLAVSPDTNWVIPTLLLFTFVFPLFFSLSLVAVNGEKFWPL